jgi:rod shape-determining protein MreD
VTLAARAASLLRDLAVAGLALAIAVLLQVTVAVDLEVLGGGADFVAVVVASLALLRGCEAGALAGFVGGLGLDALSGQPLGLAAFVYTGVGFAAGRVGERVHARAAVRPLLVAGLACALARVGVVLLGFLLGSDVSLNAGLSIGVVPVAAIGVLLAIPIHPLIRAGLSKPRPLPSPARPASSTESDGVPTLVA